MSGFEEDFESPQSPIKTDTSRDSFGPSPVRDRRDFSEAEYKRELTLHSVKIEKGQVASIVYRQQGPNVKLRPRSGVFRDFYQYGVHPSYVTVRYFKLTIPFLVSTLSASQLASEITNQKNRREAKVENKKWEEEETAELAQFVVDERGVVRIPPTPDSALELIELLKKNKTYTPYTPPLQYQMSAINLLFFLQFVPRREYLTPPLPRIVIELQPLIGDKHVLNEMKKRMLTDPSRWGEGVPVEKLSSGETSALLNELMTHRPITAEVREIIDWYKTAYRRIRLYELISNVLVNRDHIVPTIRLKQSVIEQAKKF